MDNSQYSEQDPNMRTRPLSVWIGTIVGHLMGDTSLNHWSMATYISTRSLWRPLSLLYAWHGTITRTRITLARVDLPANQHHDGSMHAGSEANYVANYVSILFPWWPLFLLRVWAWHCTITPTHNNLTSCLNHWIISIMMEVCVLAV